MASLVSLVKTTLRSLSPKGMTFEDWKPIIRSTLAAWIGLILLLVPRTLKVMGSSFLILVVGVLSPPSGPWIKSVYTTFYNILFISLSWLWYVIASRAATAARLSTIDPDALSIDNIQGFACDTTPTACLTSAIYEGRFIEWRSSLVYGIFFYFGLVFFFYMKFRFPVQSAAYLILAFINLIIPFLYGPLYPYWFPAFGLNVYIPSLTQFAICTVCSMLFWPRSMNHEYIKQIQGLLTKIEQLTMMQIDVLATDARNLTEWEKHAAIKEQARATRASLAGFGANAGFLPQEISFGQLGPAQLTTLTTSCRDIVVKIGGFTLFYDLVTHHLEAYKAKIDAGAQDSSRASRDDGDLTGSEKDHRRGRSARSTGAITPVTPRSLDDSTEELTRVHAHGATQQEQLDLVSEKLRESSDSTREKHKHAHFKIRTPKSSLLHEALHHEYRPVGTFEMHHYAEREARFPRAIEIDYMVQMMALISESSKPLMNAVISALKADCRYLTAVNKDRLISRVLRGRVPAAADMVDGLTLARDGLQTALQQFRDTGRLKMLEPYEFISGCNYGKIPHRPLLRMFYLEFHLRRFSESTLKLTQTCLEYATIYDEPRIIWPTTLLRFNFARHEEDAPYLARAMKGLSEDVESGIPPDAEFVNIETRDPDHLPPRRWYHLLGTFLVYCASIFQDHLFVFALKAGVLALLVALPAFLKSSAGWYYQDRGLWAVLMAALLQAPFTGDAIFAFIWRIIGTLAGAAIACVIWYIGNGRGQGQPYGFAAVMVPGLVLLLYIRIKWIYLTPVPAIVLTLTAVVILGYSWQDSHAPTAVNIGVGWDVAWRRFVVISIGTFAAFIWSFFPKPTTGRQVVRRRLARGIFEVGDAFIRVSNFARSSTRTVHEEHDIRDMIIKSNTKLLLVTQRLVYVDYEPPLQGPWPKDKYMRMLSIQRELLDLMVAFVNNLMLMDRTWVEPMLRRTGWYDKELVSDTLAVLFMTANSLKAGHALPQLVPSPLVDRFYAQMDRIQETHAEGSLPKTITRDTLEDPGYASFAVGSVISFAIIRRIDEMLLVTKELVGEVWATAPFIERREAYHRL